MAEAVIWEQAVAEEGAGSRVDAWCAGRLPGLLTRNAVKKALKRGEITVDGEVVESSRRLRAGQCVRQLEPASALPRVYPLALEVMHEDAHLAVVYKPAGLRVNGAAYRTLENALPHNLAPTSEPAALRVPRVAHRLDQPTQGLVLCAKTPAALIGLGRAFQAREVRKTYLALAVGDLRGEGSFDGPVDGRPARTEWRVRERTRCLKSPSGWLATVELRPASGRRHQLRVHLAGCAAPILGDGEHTPADMPVYRHKGLFLAAVGLELKHPITGMPLVVRVEEPAKFASMRRREARRWQRHHAE